MWLRFAALAMPGEAAAAGLMGPGLPPLDKLARPPIPAPPRLQAERRLRSPTTPATRPLLLYPSSTEIPNAALSPAGSGRPRRRPAVAHPAGGGNGGGGPAEDVPQRDNGDGEQRARGARSRAGRGGCCSGRRAAGRGTGFERDGPALGESRSQQLAPPPSNILGANIRFARPALQLRRFDGRC